MCQGNCVATRISISQPTAQQATKNKITISIVTIRFYVTTKTTKESKRYFSRHRKLCRDIIDRLKEENVCRDRENYVTIRKIMSQQDQETGGDKKLVQTDFVLQHKVIML